MKWTGTFVVMALLASLPADDAWADSFHHSSVQFVSGYDPWPFEPFPVFVDHDPWPFEPFPVYPYPPRVVYAPAPMVLIPPPVYVEKPREIVKASAATVTLEPGYWYYCGEAKAYYPYVKQCSGPWQKVAPQPAQ